MADFIDNAELGAAGVADALEHASAEHPVVSTILGGPLAFLLGDADAHHAADTYAEQTAEAKKLTVDESASLRSKAQGAEKTQAVLSKAAKKTADDVAAKAKSGLGKLLWIGGGVAVVVGLVALAQVLAPLKAAAKVVTP